LRLDKNVTEQFPLFFGSIFYKMTGIENDITMSGTLRKDEDVRL
jgi:hypothetical protein